MLICLETEEECSFHTLIRQCSLHVSEQLKIPIEISVKLPGSLMQVLKLNCGEKEKKYVSKPLGHRRTGSTLALYLVKSI